MKILIIYDSKTGNTEKMAKAIANGVKETGVTVDLKKLGESFPLTLLGEYNYVIFGSPTRYADVTEEMREFIRKAGEFIKLGKIKINKNRAGIFGSYGYDGAWVMEERLKGYIEALGYIVYPKVCVMVDSEIKRLPTEKLLDCRDWAKNLVESFK
jgi:flavodoxin